MKFCLAFLTLLLLTTGSLSQDFDLSDALDDPKPTPAKPKEKPKVPENPKSDDGGFNLDLGDAVEPDKPAVEPPKTGGGGGGGGGGGLGGGGGDGFNLDDALGPDLNPDPKKPVNPPNSGGGGGGGGGGNFDDSDLINAAGGNYKPDGGNSGNSDHHGGADQPQDPDLLWGLIQKMLNANMPEEFYAWLSNFKKTLEPLLERALDLLHAAP